MRLRPRLFPELARRGGVVSFFLAVGLREFPVLPAMVALVEVRQSVREPAQVKMPNKEYWKKYSLKISSPKRTSGAGPIAGEKSSSGLVSASLRSAVPQFTAQEALTGHLLVLRPYYA